MLSQRSAPLVLLFLLTLSAPAQAGVNWWTPVGPEGGSIVDLAIEPVTRTIYAGTLGGDVFVSRDGGGQWQRRSRGMGVGAALMDLAVASAPVPTAYAAKDDGLFRTTNGGITWTALDVSGVTGYRGAYAVAVHPADASTVYVGAPYVTSFMGVLKSTDGGESWTEVFHESSCSFIEDLAVDPHDPSTVYIACHQTDVSPVFRSSDGGATWEPKGSGLPAGASYLQRVQLAPDSDTPGVLYLTLSVFNAAAGRYEPLLYKSVDRGEHWTRSGPGGFPLAVGPSGLVVAGRHRSTDGGASWTEAALLPDAALAYAVDPADPRVVYAGTASSGVFKSADAAAASWSPASRGLFATRVTALAIDPRRPSTLYAFIPGLGLRKSLSAGSRWRRADAGLPVEKISGRSDLPPVLAVDPVDPSTLYIGWMRGFARSNDGGISWTVLAPPDGCLGINDLAIDPETPANLYATGWLSCGGTPSNCLVFRSGDAGETWTCSMPPRMQYADQIVIDPQEPSWIYVRGLDRLWRSSNGGRTWRSLERGLRNVGSLWELAVDPADPRRLYVATERGLYKSTDRGSTWALSNRGLPPDHHIRRIVVDPLRPRNVYAGGTRGVYISTNGGRSWHPLNGGLPGFSGELVLNPQDPSRLYAGSAGSGLYTYDRR